MNPTPAGVIAAVALIQRDGWSGYQAGEILVLAVTDACPNQLELLQRFANRYAGGIGEDRMSMSITVTTSKN